MCSVPQKRQYRSNKPVKRLDMRQVAEAFQLHEPAVWDGLRGALAEGGIIAQLRAGGWRGGCLADSRAVALADHEQRWGLHQRELIHHRLRENHVRSKRAIPGNAGVLFM